MNATETIVRFLPVAVFAVWCLWGVDWRKTWPVLREGGWMPLVLVGVMAGVVWSLVFPSTANVFGVVPIPNVLWRC